MATHEAVATTVACSGGTLEMDGHRPIEYDTYTDGGQQPTRQMRVTDNHGDVVELALNRRDVQNIIDVLELYT